MNFTKEWLQQCETLVANGKTGEVVQQLLSVKEETGYKKEILQLNSRWKILTREQMNGTLSSDEKTLQLSRFNKGLLLLLEALGKELAGGKVDKNIFHNLPNAVVPYRPVWQTYLPIVLTAIASWAISYFAYANTPEVCQSATNINGGWQVFSNAPNEASRALGNATILHPECETLLQINGVLSSKSNEEVDFNSKIAGIKGEGEIFMVYENFNGESGLCHGLVLSDEDNEFTLKCTDLAGYDKDGQEVSYFRFVRK